MIYITGDCHGDFRRFTKRYRMKMTHTLTENDYVIVCGDFGLCWARDKEFEYNCNWLSGLPFTILWVQGNHENYDMLKEFPVEMWHGGKTRHIVRDKIILLERGQIFDIEGSTFFTFGGASSHDVQGGILDKDDPLYNEKRKIAVSSGLPYRVNHYSWWKEELPNEEEISEGISNLAKAGNKVDYIISHCGSNSFQNKITKYFESEGVDGIEYSTDILTDYFETLETLVDYKHWYCGHYHQQIPIDGKHTVLYGAIVPLEFYKNM